MQVRQDFMSIFVWEASETDWFIEYGIRFFSLNVLLYVEVEFQLYFAVLAESTMYLQSHNRNETYWYYIVTRITVGTKSDTRR